MEKVFVFIRKIYCNLFPKQRKDVQCLMNEKNQRKDRENNVEIRHFAGSYHHVLLDLENFLKEHYLFRFNLLTEVTEYRKKYCEYSSFKHIAQRELNTLCLAARKSGIDCWDRDVSRFVNSEEIESYHPFKQFMDELPEWDGTDRLQPFALRVSDEPVWVKSFSRWMMGLCAQWLGMDTLHANSVAPVLISSKQGMHKSTFCKMLVPECLQSYYTDCFDLNAVSGAEQKLTAL